MKISTLSGALGLIAVIAGAVVFSLDRFESKVAAQSTHEKLATDDERGRLESELRLTELEITFLLNVLEHREHTATEKDKLAYLQAKRLQLEARLRDVIAKG